jgi:replicative DNA helicase
MFDEGIKKSKKSRKPNLSAPADLAVLEKVPPHDLDAERAVLGALLREPELCDDVVMILRDPDDFYHDAHSRIFSHMMKMRSDNSAIDLLLLVNNLQTTDELELVGGHFYLGELMKSVPTSVHAVHYAKIVHEKATLRRLIHTGSEIVRDAYTPQTSVKELLDRSASQMNQLCEAQTTNQVTDMAALMMEASDYLNRKVTGDIDGVKTGFFDLDNLIEGFHPNELIILAARPGMGKTALALNIAENIAVQDKQTVLFVSLEMAKLELALRLICSRAKLDSYKIRRNLLSKEERGRFIDACNELGEAPMFIDDTPSRSVVEIAAVARRLKRQQDLKLIVVDYIGLIRPENPEEPRQEQVAKFARRLKLLARELHTPVLCLAQLNRQADTGRKDERPRLSQLRESGAIEQDADVVMFVHRKDVGKSEDDAGNNDLHNQAELIVAKQRNGPTDDISLIFRREWTRFFSASEHHEQEYQEYVESLGGHAEMAGFPV